MRRSVAPPATSSRMIPHIRTRLVGSRPVVGSSRKSTGGCVTSPAARSRRRRIPPEYVLRIRSAASASSNCSSRSAARARASRRRRPLRRPTIDQVLAARQQLVEGRVLRRHADLPLDGARLPDDVVACDARGAAVRPSEGSEDPDRGRLPGPVRAEHAEDGPLRHGEVEPVQGDRRAVPLPQPCRLDHGNLRHLAPYRSASNFGAA